MNYVKRLPLDDGSIFMELLKVPGLTNVTALTSAMPGVLGAYRAYLSARGGRSKLTPLSIPPGTKSRFSSLFDREVGPLKFIRSIRNELSTQACPMCGSHATGSVDHLLERQAFAEFSIYSPNLVPACGCNSRRRPCVIGAAPADELHPYFDKILRRRLIRPLIHGSFVTPEIVLAPMPGLGKYTQRVQAHIDAVIQPNNVITFLRKRWELMLANPSVALGLGQAAIPGLTIAALRAAIEMRRDAEEQLNGSKNCWHAVFLSGLLRGPVLSNLHSYIVNPSSGPFVID